MRTPLLFESTLISLMYSSSCLFVYQFHLTTNFGHFWFWAANGVMVGTNGFELGTADVGPDIEPCRERGQRVKRLLMAQFKF